MVSPPKEGGIKEARDPDNNIIISDSMLRTIIPPQINNMSAQYKVMCGWVRFRSAKIIYS